MKSHFFPILKWGALAIYTFFAYHLLLTPLLLEFSMIGILIGWGSLLALFFIIPKTSRVQLAVFVLLVIFTTTAFHQAGTPTSIQVVIFYIAIIAVVYLAARFYGKLSKSIIITLLIVVLAIDVSIPRDDIRLFTHFYKIWESEKLYTGTKVDYFPLFTRDINGDGQKEIITFGNKEEQDMLDEEHKRKDLNPEGISYYIDEERLFLYVYTWNGTDFVRINNENIMIDELRNFIPIDYPGFPYYSLNSGFTLTPTIQMQSLSEQTGQLGASPFYVMDLNLQSIEPYLESLDGTFDKKDDFRFDTNIESITIKRGQLIIETNGHRFSSPTKATKIIGLIQTEEGLGILLLSDQLELWSFDNDQITLTHVLTEAEISDIMSSEFNVADITFDGRDEILISSDTSRIIRPLADGNWEILFTSPDNSLRFEDFDTIGAEKTPTIISLAKSKVRNQPLRFLTSFTYTDKGLEQNWKSFTSLINVQSVDVDGNGQNELLATIWRSHKIYVFNKHGLPVTSALILMFAFLFGYSIYRRVRYHA